MELRCRPSHAGLAWRRVWVCSLSLGVALSSSLAAQVIRQPTEPLPPLVDSADVRSQARREQARFELRRRRLLPLSHDFGGGSCDEVVGRFCTWYDEGEWVPRPEPTEIVAMREDLLAYLDSVQGLVPGDGWVLGQRVWYRAEGGLWDEARHTAAMCGGAEPWWCLALEGFALHGAGRYAEAEAVFDRALATMDPEVAQEWRVPRRAVPHDTRDLLGDAEGPELVRVLRRLWLLADPLYLAPGNDRKTAHYARWTVAGLRERARNPFQISWGRDLEELTIRHGWELGWERRRAPDYSLQDNVVGHKHPEGRDFMPSRRAVEDLSLTRPEDVRADRDRPRSLYAPAYAPVLLPMAGQIAVFPRADRMAVVATWFLPEDTTWHAAHSHERPWMEAGRQAGRADEAGAFLLDGNGMVRERRFRGRTTGATVLEAPAGAYLVGAEAWSPSRRLAGRHRFGIRRDTLAPDIPSLSDLLLVQPGPGDPATLQDAAREALADLVLREQGAVGVVWEVNGFGWRPETLTYELSVERSDRGFLRRVGEGLRLVGRDQPLSLSWDEPGPDRPVAVLRRVVLDLPTLGPGRYRIRLRATGAGRSSLTSQLEFRVPTPAPR